MKPSIASVVITSCNGNKVISISSSHADRRIAMMTTIALAPDLQTSACGRFCCRSQLR
jgi:hypothetical protein